MSKLYLYNQTEAQILREKNAYRQAIHKIHVRVLHKLKLYYNHLS